MNADFTGSVYMYSVEMLKIQVLNLVVWKSAKPLPLLKMV